MSGRTRAAASVAARAIEDCYQADVDVEDSYDENELSDGELSDEGSDYGSGVSGYVFIL